jgi:FtsH-binding integral membrane protein
MIMGRKENELSGDDYIIGALMLYVDIINIFLFILQLFGSDRD